MMGRQDRPHPVPEVRRAHEWTTLDDLRCGAVFETRRGYRGVKSEYHMPNGQPECVLLASGEYAHFNGRGDTLVREIEVPA